MNDKIMRTLRILTTILILSVILTKTSKAQQKATNAPRNVEHLKKSVGITEPIASKVDSVLAAYKSQVKKVTENQSLTAVEKRERFAALMKEKQKALSPLLTESQMSKVVPTTELKPTSKAGN